MEQHTNGAKVPSGAALRGATITVTNADGLAAIFSDNGVTAKANPFTSDARTGNFSFRAANGEYTVSISKSGAVAESYVVQLYDPADDPASAENLAASGGAALVGVIQSGTGAIARTVQDKLRETVSVLDFMTDEQRADVTSGAGELDVTAAVQAACDAAATKLFGGNVFAPAGKYRLTSTVSLPLAKFLRFRGEGKATRFFGATAFGHLFAVSATNSAAHGSIFEDFMLAGAASGATSGISLTDANTFQINRVHFQNQTVGVTQATSYAVEYNGCVFDVCYSEAIKATTSAHNTVIDKCNFFSCGVTGTTAAVKFAVASNNLAIINSDFENNYRMLSLNACTSVALENNYVEYSDASDIEFLGTCEGVVINKNWLALGAVPFVLTNLFGAQFKHNTVYNHTVNIGTNVNQLECAYNSPQGTGAVNINYIKHESRASGGIPSIAPHGDANVQMRVSSRGTGDVALYTNNENILSLLIGYVASAVNYLKLTPSAAGFPVAITAQGASTDTSIRVFPAGNGDLMLARGDFKVQEAGSGLQVAEGSNAKQGVTTLVAGTATVANTNVTANSRIFVQRQTDSGTVAASYSITRVNGTSFTITAKDGSGAAQTADTSIVAYQIFEPA